MQLNQSSTERRSGDRRRCVGDTHIVWRDPAQPKKGGVHGWLWDISPSGVGFVADADRKPLLGDEIEVHPDRGPNNFLCRVVRTTALNDSSILVGCELSSAGPTPTASVMPRGPHFLQAAISRAARGVIRPAMAARHEAGHANSNLAAT